MRVRRPPTAVDALPVQDSSKPSIVAFTRATAEVSAAAVASCAVFNIDPFEGADNGPSGEVKLAGVTNIFARLGKFDPQLADQSFDLLFSISVVEHVEDPDFAAFFDDCVRLLKPGGQMYHAIDMYLSESPTPFWTNRWDMYRAAVSKRDDVAPIGKVFDGPAKFTTDLASNPDNIMYSWKQLSPSLDELRKQAQSVSLVIGVQKK